MPYFINWNAPIGPKQISTYEVINVRTGKIKARHTSLAKARAQVRSLRDMEEKRVKK